MESQDGLINLAAESGTNLSRRSLFHRAGIAIVAAAPPKAALAAQVGNPPAAEPNAATPSPR